MAKKPLKQLTWSAKLFMRINKTIGTRPIVDKLMMFAAHDLMYVLGFLAMLWATMVLFDQDPGSFQLYIKLLLTAGVFGFITSWTIAIISPRQRPFRELDGTKQLMQPFGRWKTFPSDHAMTSFIIAEVTALMGAPFAFSIALVAIALLISVARVYVGVHYPRDIIGGIVVATVVVLLSNTLLTYITQPVYEVFKTMFL